MNKTIYALGFFDGVHVGHAALLDRCKTLAREENYRAGVVTFAAHPDTLVLGNTPPLINTPYDREKLLRERFSMEQVVTLPFDEQMHTMPWRDFLNMLIRDYAAAGFVCGEDFRFGYRGEGNADALEDFCRANGLVSAVVNDQMIDGIRVSSTYIRRQIETGDMETAREISGTPPIFSAVPWFTDTSWDAGWASPPRICACRRGWQSPNSASTPAAPWWRASGTAP